MKIQVCIPNYNGYIHSSLVKDILGFDFDYEVKFKVGSLISRMRNEFISEFLREKEFSHLLFIDADLFDFSETLKVMIESDKKLVGGIYRKKMKKEEYNVNLVTSIEETLEFGDIIPVKHIGAGLMLIHRDVAECLANLVESYAHGNGERYFDMFKCGVVDDRYLSEDYYFCELANMAGFRTYGVLKSELTHNGIMNYRGKFSSYLLKAIK